MRSLDRQLSLQVAYQISEDLKGRPASDLFMALDRFYADKDLVDETSRYQRFEATQRIAQELDRRGIPMRDPKTEAANIEAMRTRILDQAA